VALLLLRRRRREREAIRSTRRRDEFVGGDHPLEPLRRRLAPRLRLLRCKPSIA
jgi:hypothetical protein